MKKDPALILTDTFDVLRDMRAECSNQVWQKLLNAYEGFDIVEVICREAAAIVAKNVDAIRPAHLPPDYQSYLRQVATTAEKYAASEDWPEIETRRAEAFGRYVRSL